MSTLSVVGGGVIGLSVAWRAAHAGWTVTVHDPDPGSGASWVAGGMLAPLSEGWPGEEDVLAFGAASLDRWPGFARHLRDATGTDVFTSTASMTVALDAADAADLRTVADWVRAQGYEMRTLGRADIRDLEPALGPRIRFGLLAPTELSVDNRALVDALRRAAAAAGVRFVAAPVRDVAELTDDRVVLAAGSASARLWPGLPVRPVKGEVLRLRVRPGATPPPRHTVRASVHGRPAYLVPRGDGLVVGATQYEAADTEVTVAGVRDLIADAEILLPTIGEYALYEASAGLRPMSPDNLPLIGRLSERVIVATGHGRNGVLFTPLTADAVLAELADDPMPEAKRADHRRFTEEKLR
ncbi:MAG: glycine oxidase ThiO [Rhodococcus sp.]|uniref:glycine oxidase ThiO n=1 Tax=Rhodococcus TaxID=1827 RepID=UPI00169069BD|nr:glycine oxidase ThiO [Rhodococcus sp. (in: high G+C Gram-positive bacteria)]NLV78722.1 glycine oxidase ThiO [Rhodococcus sp. (in: high G+C Gram-positive bacteria)]